MKRITLIATCLTLTALGGCASHDAQDTALLGAATRSNIALQSVRNVDVPNTAAVNSSSGVRAAEAVKRLNEGTAANLRDTSSNEGG